MTVSTPGPITASFFNQQVAIYDKSIAQLLSVSDAKPCLSK